MTLAFSSFLQTLQLVSPLFPLRHSFLRPVVISVSSANDTSLHTAKRAYLSIIANPPAIFSSPTSDTPAIIRPYDGPDAQAIIQNVNSRGQNPTRGHNARSVSVAVSSQRTRKWLNGHTGERTAQFRSHLTCRTRGLTFVAESAFTSDIGFFNQLVIG